MNLRFRICLLLYAVIGASRLFAQDIPNRNVKVQMAFFSRIEFVAGPNWSFLRGNNDVDNTFQNKRKIRNGFSFGIGFSHSMSDRLELSAKILFERKGSISELTGTYYDTASQSLKQGTAEFNYRYDYYSLPILIDYKFGSSRQFGIGLGPFISYLQKQVVKETYPFFGSIYTRDQTDLNSKFDLGLAFQLAYHVPLNAKLDLAFQILNTLGLINTRLNTYSGQVSNSNNTSILIGIILKK